MLNLERTVITPHLSWKGGRIPPTEKRVISGLRSAELRDRPPVKKKTGTLSEAAKKGLRYEKMAQRECREVAARREGWTLHLNPIFVFTDDFGPGWAEADAIAEGENHLIVMEMKLTWRADAFVQLRSLYAPLAEMVWPGRDTCFLQVAKNLTRKTEMTTLARLLDEPKAGENLTWHLINR